MAGSGIVDQIWIWSYCIAQELWKFTDKVVVKLNIIMDLIKTNILSCLLFMETFFCLVIMQDPDPVLQLSQKGRFESGQQWTGSLI